MTIEACASLERLTGEIQEQYLTERKHFREFQKFDVLCFNETSCKLDNLANGSDDLLIEGFHYPIIQINYHNI